MPVISNVDRLGMKMLTAIKENDYRSKDAKHDYCPISIEARIAELATKQAKKYKLPEAMPENHATHFPPPIIKKITENINEKITEKIN